MSGFNEVKGIGDKTEKILNKLSIYTIDDLINYYPFRYAVLKKTDLNSEKVIISGIIESTPTTSYFKKINKISFRINSNNKLINVVIFNRAFLKNNLYVSKVVTVIGKYDETKNLLTAQDIRLDDIGKGRIEPIYHLAKGITNKVINKYINNAFKVSNIIDYIPQCLIEKYNFINKKEAIYTLHNPSDNNKLKNSILRSKYEELFLFMLKINALKLNNNKENIGFKKDININEINKLIDSLQFKLTKDQLNALNDIFNDLQSDKRMNRLLQGDVGSGKTIVAIISMYSIYLCGYQSALMSPTEVLAKQHYENIIKLFDNTNVKVGLLLGSMKKSEKERIYKQIESGEINFIVGTHSLIQDNIKYNNLGLVITDEQHRFGVNQRNNLRNKGNMPDVLYMSATPIPRTYALTIYGDMDISVIKSMPKGRKEIITKVYNNENIKEVLGKIKIELENNHQIYIISPLIEGSDTEEEDIKKLEKKFKLAFKSYSIGILHGKLTSKEKEDIMNKFTSKEIDILISTTIVEVGVDVKNATMIVIFDAYKFGLATLHQLRGRVGRNNLQSYCILISNRESERLNIMERVSDGFILAEEDLKLRGYGDLFGIKQSGDMTFKIANLSRDYKILLQAKEDSINILNNINNYPILKKILKDSINLD